jgi:hypothetical protein
VKAGDLKRLSIGLALALFALGAAGPALAGDEARARAHFDAGIRLLDARDFARALGEFRAAYAIWQNPKILLNIGTSLRELGREAEAANAYARYLRGPGIDAGKAAEVEKLLSEIDARVGRVELVSNERDARILIDGALSVEWHPEEALRLAPGAHTLVAEKSGFSPAVMTISVSPGETRKVELVLVGHEAPAEDSSRVATPSPEADRGAEPQAELGLSHAGQLGAFLRADADGAGRGVVVAPGVSFGLGDHVELAASGLIGTNKGAWFGGRVLVLKGALKPSLLLAAPIFFVDGARVGLQAAGGVSWDASRHFGVFVDLGAVYFPAPPEGYQKAVFLPSAGVQARL